MNEKEKIELFGKNVSKEKLTDAFGGKTSITMALDAKYKLAMELHNRGYDITGEQVEYVVNLLNSAGEDRISIEKACSILDLAGIGKTETIEFKGYRYRVNDLDEQIGLAKQLVENDNKKDPDPLVGLLKTYLISNPDAVLTPSKVVDIVNQYNIQNSIRR